MTPGELAQATAPALDPASLDRVRAQLGAELERPAPRPFGLDAALLVLGVAGFTAAVGAALGLSGNFAANLGALRAVSVVALGAGLSACGFAALAPPRPGRLAGAVGLTVASMLALVILRGPGLPSASPPWVCTVSHLGVDLLPMAFVVWRMRVGAPSLSRALAGGLAAGVPGAALGELACGRGALHVALFHLPAWLAIAGLTWAVARAVRPVTFAP